MTALKPVVSSTCRTRKGAPGFELTRRGSDNPQATLLHWASGPLRIAMGSVRLRVAVGVLTGLAQQRARGTAES